MSDQADPPAEHPAAREVRRLRKLLAGSSDIVDVVDSSGVLLHEHQSRGHILGYSPGEMLGHSLMEHVHPEDVASALQALQGARDLPGGETRAVMRYRHKQGHWVVIEVTARNLLDDPDVGGIVLYARDITIQTDLEQKLRLAQRMEVAGRMASGIAHDFNNLLAVIAMSVSASARGPEATRVALADIARVVERGTGLVKRLMAFVRDRPLRPRRFDLTKRVADLEGMLGALLSDCLEFTLEVPDVPCPIDADPTQIEQALLNLVLNARDAMPQGGRVTLRVVSDAGAGRVAIEVEDTGEGMDEETRRRAFEPFFTTKGPARGTGLGLATVRDTVQAAGGQVELFSTPSRGTRVRIELPLAES
ncbi:MAG: PAS domain S-box protein [Polyangiaceae bacterium]|nr:PAS domain S-box protein [Polyangiaceae bacterium]